jgi:oxalate---CoA ligase
MRNVGGESSSCIYDLLVNSADSHRDSPVFLAPDREGLTYARLLAAVRKTVAALNAAGISRGDRVALTLPEGPEAALAFLAVSSAATAAPLNPAYRAEEYEFYLSDLGAKALLLPRGSGSPARRVASARGVSVIELSWAPEGPAGDFDLDCPSGSARPPALALPDDLALILHTSGTTSRPKMVPLTHRNLVASARHIRTTLRLGPDDRCLNVMPLFHIHGLIGAVLSSIAAGGSVVCAPGFQAPLFLEWVREFEPTWFTAVPTMHQAILARAEKTGKELALPRLRFIRSSSSALPAQVAARLEETFHVPVIESYGMTEAAHQMASNPLPPGLRKPGSVGLAAGPQVAVMDETGILKGTGEVGEIVIRGPNVASGYLNNPAANAAAFVDGWFRTGDLGYCDRDQYLFLVGRSKEIINRGGEKISPREIDEVLLDHPAVEQAVAFALPHERLGEEVGAAVVLCSARSVSQRELQDFTAARLADFKVPARIVFVDEIPLGPTGKLQRVGLAEKLGVTGLSAVGRPAPRPFRPPSTPTEKRLCALWRELLGLEEVGADDNFFDLGGDSVLAARLAVAIEKETGQTVRLRDMGVQTLCQHASQLDAGFARPARSGSPSWRKRLAGLFRAGAASLGE